MGAYAYHAALLGRKMTRSITSYPGAFEFIENKLGLNEWLGLVLKCGEINLKVMELLDTTNTGHALPCPHGSAIKGEKGKAILVSRARPQGPRGDPQTDRGKGIFVYTHGEMLPTHGYPT